MSLSAIRTAAFFEREAGVFKALGHPARVAILHALAEGPVCACELAAVAECGFPAASRHLAVLRVAGLVAAERRAQKIFYRLTRPCVLGFIDCLAAPAAAVACQVRDAR
jgi:DNA-binding transcriptional ArsR family regulator